MKKLYAFLIDHLIDIVVIVVPALLVFLIGYLFTGRWPSWWLLVDITITVLVIDFLMKKFRKK